MKKERIIYFDLIKLIATLSVFFCHFTRSLEANGVIFDFKILPDTVFSVNLGSFGVSLFFIVSGAALMYVYDEKIDWKSFIAKRFKGIYPLFWLTYIIAFFITFYNNGGINHTIPKSRIIYSILGCDGNVQWFEGTFYLVGEWFLSVIILLYVIFPILRWMVKKNPYITMAAAVVIFIILLNIWNSKMPLECFFLSRLPEFVFGMFFVKVIKKPRLWLGAVGMAVLIGAEVMETELLNVNSVIRTEVIGISAFCFLAFCFQAIKGKIFADVSKFVNKYTYGFFLTHHFIQIEILRQFSGKVLYKADVILAAMLCLTMTIIATLLLSRLNGKILSTCKNVYKA